MAEKKKPNQKPKQQTSKPFIEIDIDPLQAALEIVSGVVFDAAKQVEEEIEEVTSNEENENVATGSAKGNNGGSDSRGTGGNAGGNQTITFKHVFSSPKQRKSQRGTGGNSSTETTGQAAGNEESEEEDND